MITEAKRALALVCLLVLAWLIPGLFARDPWKPDAAYSFGVIHEVLNGGSWLTPTLAGEPFMEKPPLFYLTAAAFAYLFRGWLPLHEGAHFVSALYVALASVFVAAAAGDAYGRTGPPVAAALFCGSIGLLLPAHLMITDLAQLAGTAMAMHGLLLGMRRPVVGGSLLGTGLGMAFMSKGLLISGTFAITLCVLPLAHEQCRRRDFALAVLAAAAALLPWLLVWPLLLYRHSPALFDAWLWDNQIGRFLGANRLGPRAEPLHYFRVLPWFALPTLPLALYAGCAARKTLLRQPAFVALTITAGAILLVLTAARTARDVSALPLLVPLALVAVPGVRALPERFARRIYQAEGVCFSLLLLAVWLLGIALLIGAPHHLHDALVAVLPGYTPRISGWTLAVMTEIARHIRPAAPCMASSGLGEPQRAMLHYFAGVRTRRIEIDPHALACDTLLVQYRRGEAAYRPDAGWEVVWRGSRAPGSDEMFVLYYRLP